MALNIETFSNRTGGNPFFKAIGHPLTARKVPDMIARMKRRRVAVYDPRGLATTFAALWDLSGLEVAGYFVQDLGDLDRTFEGHSAQPVTDLATTKFDCLFLIAFDAGRALANMAHLLPAEAEVVTLDEARLPEDMLTNPRNYLDGRNFATNFAFFREQDGHHTRLVTANYWSSYGAEDPELWCCLIDSEGACLAEWRQALPPAGGTIVLDSRDVRERFGLEPFTGQLFIHVVRIAGHDVVKYALDTFGDDPTVLSSTHDANAWPSDLYAGLPAPGSDESVILWVQNSHPTPIPAGGIGLGIMGEESTVWLQRPIAPFGVYALDTRELLPETHWPRQLEVRAGKHFVRPRYEVVSGTGRRHIAHANVERTDLKADTRLRELRNLIGKGYILPAPLLPPRRFRSLVLPTPMATTQQVLPLSLRAYDGEGREIGQRMLGRLPRDHRTAVEAGELIDGALEGAGASAWGHMELVYDLEQEGDTDGWLHAIFRYEDTDTGHAAETSFGSHMFNMLLTYRGEPQSYGGPPPGLSTRLFLRLGPAPTETACHLIYPASLPWHASSETRLVLHDGQGAEIETADVRIPCGGSLYWRPAETFSVEAMTEAGDTGYVLVRDVTCRLFGYHCLFNGDRSFSLDHMFGF